MKLASNDVFSIILAILWLMLGISVLWYANHKTLQGDAFGKILSFWGLSLLLNAALAVYIPDIMTAGMLCLAVFLIGLVLLLIWKRKHKLKNGINS